MDPSLLLRQELSKDTKNKQDLKASKI